MPVILDSQCLLWPREPGQPRLGTQQLYLLPRLSAWLPRLILEFGILSVLRASHKLGEVDHGRKTRAEAIEARHASPPSITHPVGQASKTILSPAYWGPRTPFDFCVPLTTLPSMPSGILTFLFVSRQLRDRLWSLGRGPSRRLCPVPAS